MNDDLDRIIEEATRRNFFSHLISYDDIRAVAKAAYDEGCKDKLTTEKLVEARKILEQSNERQDLEARARRDLARELLDEDEEVNYRDPQVRVAWLVSQLEQIAEEGGDAS